MALDILSRNELSEFFGLVKTIKKEKAIWNIMEVSLLEEFKESLSTKDITQKIQNIFSDKKGWILECNHKDIIVLICLNRQDTTAACQRIENNLPEHSCYVNIQEFSKDGIEKIQVRLVLNSNDNEDSIQKRRIARNYGVLLLATQDTELKVGLGQGLQRFGRVFFAENVSKLLLKYHELAPNVLIWDIDTVHENGHICYDLLRSRDPDAYILSVSHALDVHQLMEAKQKGVVELLKHPLKEQQLEALILNCPEFKYGISGVTR